MSFKLIADNFSITRDSSHFIQLKTIKKPRSDEEVWLVIEIEGSSKYARSTVQNIIKTIEDVFFEQTGMGVYERFENMLKEINLIVSNLEEKHGGESLGSINAILAAFSGNELHLTQANNAEAYLIRQKKLSLISEGLGGKSKDLFLNIATGEMMPDDKIIISTSRLLRIATHSQLVQIFGDGVTEAVDALRELVMAENELNLGATCLHIKLPQRATAMGGAMTKNPLFAKLKAGLSSLFGFLKTQGKKLPVSGKIQEHAERLNVNRKGILVALMVILLILVISVSVLVDSRRNAELRNEYLLRIESLNQDLQVANTKGYSNDKETANAILDQIEREARDILGTSYFRSEALALLEKSQETRDSINNTTRVKAPKAYVNLANKNESIQALGFVNLDGNFFVYEYNKLYEVILDQVLDSKTIDSSEVVTRATPMDDQGVITFLTQSGRVLEYENGLFSFANTNDASWQTGVDIAAYGRNIYLLNPEKNQIYKYSRSRGQYSSASSYNTDADLSGALSMAIDGDVYILKKGGEVVKLFKSKQQSFRIDDLAADLSEATKVFTLTEQNHLYFLDPVNKKVIMVEKDKAGVARYLGQVVFEGIEVKDIYVNKNEDKLFLLTGQEIYQVDI